MITTNKTQSIAGLLSRWMGVCTLAILTALAPTLRAQGGSTGTVTGTVLDSSTGKYLEGAEVSIESQGVSLRTNSERSGEFSITGVPAGLQTLVVAYPGLESKSESVTVVAGQPVRVSVTLAAETIMLEALTVSSAKEGMSQAQALQKASVQFKVVAANDQFGPVSEGNIGEYLKFLPGVNIDYNVNDARGVSLRGLSTAFTIVSVDGTPMAGASSTDDTRRFEFEQIAMNNVETTELYKTVTPDIPASATGGYVNFVTKSAFDRKDVSVLTYDLSFNGPSSNMSLGKEDGVWGHDKEFVVRPSLELNYARRVNSKVGFNVNYRFSEKYDDSPRNELIWNTTQYTYAQVTAGTTPANIFQAAAPRLQEYRFRNEQKLTHREAFAAKVDYLITDQTKLTVSGQWNWYDLMFTQRGPQFVLGTNSTVANAATRNGDSFRSGLAGASISNGTLQREKYGTTVHFNGTLEHSFNSDSKASLTGYWSEADGQYRDFNKGFISTVPQIAQGASTFTSFTVNNPMSLGDIPTITLDRSGTAVPLDYVRSLSNYTLSNTATGGNFQSRQWTAEDTKKGVNGKYSIDLAGLPFSFKVEAGFALDQTERSIDRPDLRAVIPATTGAALTALVDEGWNGDVGFGFGPVEAIDPYSVWKQFSNVTFNVNGYDKRNFDEDNTAGYVRLDAQVLPDLLVVGGVRWEEREIEASGVTGSPARARLSAANLSYDNWYPSIQLKYTPAYAREFVARAGYSMTVGHPDYSDLLPTFTVPDTVGGSNGTISVPSNELQPYTSHNFDVSVDYYIGRTGVAGISAFRKNVSDYITPRSMSQAERDAYLTSYGLTPSDFGNTPGTVKENGSKSSLQGFELSYAQRLSFLPSPFNGFNVQANFSYVDVDSKDADPLRALDTLYSQLRAVSPKTANFILGYRYRAFSATGTVNWVDEALYGGFVSTNYFVGSAATATAPDTRLSVNKDELTTISLKLEYSLSRQFSIYVNIRNLTATARKEFLKGYLPENQSVVLPNRYFEFGEPSYTLGVRGTF
ncbi:MAG: TonB-dependent receptor [Nibricoccus sp.]